MTRPRKDCPAIHVEPFDMWIFVLGYVRYSMGRRSTAPSMAAEFVQRYRKHLTRSQVKQIADEIGAELAVEDAHPGHMGDPCDVATWRWLVGELRKP